MFTEEELDNLFNEINEFFIKKKQFLTDLLKHESLCRTFESIPNVLKFYSLNPDEYLKANEQTINIIIAGLKVLELSVDVIEQYNINTFDNNLDEFSKFSDEINLFLYFADFIQYLMVNKGYTFQKIFDDLKDEYNSILNAISENKKMTDDEINNIYQLLDDYAKKIPTEFIPTNDIFEALAIDKKIPFISILDL